VGAVLLGLFVPRVGMPLARVFRWLLGSILFFTALRLDFKAAVRELRRPWLVLYVALVIMAVMPFCVYGLARLALPQALAVGVLITAAMPAGTACSSLTDVIRGNAALALVGTLVTSLLCPFVTPWIIRVGTGQAAGEGVLFLLKQSGFLAVILFIPLGLAFAVRRQFPEFVRSRREVFGVLSIVALGLLILGAMASVSSDFKTLVTASPGLALRLFGFMCGFSVLLHVAGYFLAPWRPIADRAALSVNAAYVNNGLAIVFAVEFFRQIPELGANAVLPAILVEVPMVLVLVPLKAWVARRASPHISHSSCYERE
jgi:BASS family bile acid:Na+ symporter